MAYTISDLIENVSPLETASFEGQSVDVREHFDTESFPKNDSLFIGGVTLCHSIPNINQRGRCFHPGTLKNSWASAEGQLVNNEHMLKDNFGPKVNDQIIGHIIAAKHLKQNEISSKIVTAVALYRRVKSVNDIATTQTRMPAWKASMECNHNPAESALYYRGECIPAADAESKMLECVKKNSVSRYKGHELGFMLGGINGYVNFHGIALTTVPADGSIKPLKIYTSRSFKEVASIPNGGAQLVFGGEEEEGELGAIRVIGTTSESDSHVHNILSNGTVMPTNGHSHSIEEMCIEPSREPTFSGVLLSNTEFLGSETDRRSFTHSHTFSINLRSRNASRPEDTTNPEAITRSEMASFSEDFKEVLKGLKDAAAASSDSTLSRSIDKLSEIASRDAVDSRIKKEVADAVAELVDTGQLVKKEDHDKQIEDTKEEMKKKHDEDSERAKKISDRVSKVQSLGVDVEARISENSELTIRQTIESYALDDAGEASFQGMIGMIGQLKKTNSSGEQQTKTEERKDESKETASMIFFPPKTGKESVDKSSVKKGPSFGKDNVTDWSKI